VSCIEKGFPEDVSQWAPYEREYSYTLSQSIEAIVEYLERNSLKELKIGTRIIIVPGFRFRVVDMMVTNFHQPESTLILLISAFLDGDWKRVYDYALENGFRFLSYGDSSLLVRNKSNK
jgi:S-adenosylmethionine:tRNA ribosyltransferase-isomerase